MFDFNKPFGPQLKEKRKLCRLSIRELAKRSNVSHAYISQLENDPKRRPSLVAAEKISKALKPIMPVEVETNRNEGIVQVYCNGEAQVNEWLREHHNKVEVIKIDMAVSEYEPYLMVVYKTKEG